MDRKAEPLDAEIRDMATSLRPRVEKLFDELQIPTALTEIFKFISRTNKYIDETAPWILAKNEEDRPRLASVMYNLLECIRVAAVLLSPCMPLTAPKIYAQIGADESVTSWGSAGEFGALPQDARVSQGEALFPRIDLEKELDALEKLGAPVDKPVPEAKPAAKPENVTTLLDIADFAKVELRVAEIKECEAVPKSDKLLRLQIDDGMSVRQIVSGIHQWYEPADLVGRKIVLVANLKPAKLRGVESNGMLLAADTPDADGKDRARVIFVDADVPAGSKVR